MRVTVEGLRLLPDEPNHGCFRDLLSASGRGSAEPILTELAEEDKERSRRVVFKIRVRSLEQQHLIGATEGANGKQ